MSLLERMKGTGRDHPGAGEAPAPMGGDSIVNAMEATVRLGPGTKAPIDTGIQGGDSSIISEATPSELASEFHDSRLPEAGAGDASAGTGLPFIGHWPAARQQRLLVILFLVGLVGIAASAIAAVIASNRSAAQVGAAGQAQTQSQRLAKSISQALVGNQAAFGEVKDSVAVLARNVRGLRSGDGDIPAAPASLQDEVARLLPMVERAEKSSATVLGQQKTLTQVGQALRTINRQSAELLETAQTVSSLKLQGGASAAELSAVGQLVMLTQRIGKSANEFQTMAGVSPEAVFLLGKDLNSFRDITDGLINGNPELRLPGTKDPLVRTRLEDLLKQYEQTRTQASAILGNLQGLLAAREAQNAIVADSEPLRLGLNELQSGLAASGGSSLRTLVPGVLSLLLLAAGGFGLLRLFVTDQTSRARMAEAQR
ncbi:MAG: type IV pili methyl-accepting chemotaxis transducer N-terminal domain-containing protein, partial [Burkholderiales bacterium]|nr:type IV pili methyl-accepting chemotaxis transducer N-terminal domain-containing protein [Burkholderiales bacterium]